MESLFFKIANVLIDFDLLRLESITGPTLIGCSQEEIDALERKYDTVLPNSYKDFLLCFGRKADNFFREVLVHYDDLDYINSLFVKDCELDEFPPPNSKFAFSSRYETEFAFFSLYGGDNPMIYHKSDRHVREIGVFTAYMKDWIISNVGLRLKDKIQLERAKNLILSL